MYMQVVGLGSINIIHLRVIPEPKSGHMKAEFYPTHCGYPSDLSPIVIPTLKLCHRHSLISTNLQIMYKNRRKKT